MVTRSELPERNGGRVEFHRFCGQWREGVLLLWAEGERVARLHKRRHELTRCEGHTSLARLLTRSELLATLSERLAASAGAACHSGGKSISAVLRAMVTYTATR